MNTFFKKILNVQLQNVSKNKFKKEVLLTISSQKINKLQFKNFATRNARPKNDPNEDLFYGNIINL